MNSGPLGVVGAATSALTYGKENNNLLSASGTQPTNFVYDALGRLVQFSYTENSVTKTEILTWAGWTLMTREIFTGNAVSESHRYTWGTDLSGTMEGAGGVGGLLAIERNVAGSNTWDIRYTHADANGNIIALTNSSGNVSARYRYDAFGKVLSATDVDASGWVNHNIHGFSSKPSFGNQGLLYYGYRWYSPSLGRWINRDPIEESGGMNLYGFVGNDGVGMWDILGLKISTECYLAVIAAMDILNLFNENWKKYEPRGDAKGGFPMPHGNGLTKPGGHYNELKDLQNALRKRLKLIWKKCIEDDDNSCGPPNLRLYNYEILNETANRPIPVPPGIPPRDPGDKPWEPDYTEPEPINEPVNEPIQWPEVEVKPQTTFAVGLGGALVGLAAAAWGIATQF
jgi:RHS repeat-associated protein